MHSSVYSHACYLPCPNSRCYAFAGQVINGGLINPGDSGRQLLNTQMSSLREMGFAEAAAEAALLEAWNEDHAEGQSQLEHALDLLVSGPTDATATRAAYE